MVEKMKVGIIGLGNISPAYIKGCREYENLELVACADLLPGRVKTVAEEYAIPRALTVDELLADDEIEIVVNLTIPAAHAAVSQDILSAGKHVYSEKPLAITPEDARAIVETAERRGLRVGCAPDTFLFAPHQTCRKLVDDGVIGTPVAAVGFMAGHGPESWHPNPDFFYAAGGGPMLDMGPYYVTCLVNLLGPVARVSGVARVSFPERIAKDGHHIPVTVPTHYAGTLEFESGAIATLITSFDVWGHRLPQMEIYGEKGSLVVPDPNGHNPREVQVMLPETHQWEETPLAYPDIWARGIGLADMADAIQHNRPHRASGALAYHVLEVMSSVALASETGSYVNITSKIEQPEAIPVDVPQVFITAAAKA